MPERALIWTFKETKLFTRLVTEYLTDDQFQLLQSSLTASPTVGDAIPKTGGIRKLRWSRLGRGKRSGYRVIYFVQATRNTIWLLTIYPKNVADDIPAELLRKIRREIESESD